MNSTQTVMPVPRTIGPDSGTAQGGYDMFALGHWLRYSYSLVRRNLLWIGLILGAAVALAVVVTMLQTPLYTASTTIQINDQSESVLGDELEKQSAVNGWDVERFLNTQLEILRSQGVARRVAKSLNLANDPQFFAAMQVEQDLKLPAKAREDMAVALLQSAMSSDLPRETRIATVGFTSANAEYSAKIVNSFADEFIQASLQRRYDSSAYARDFIAGQLGEARARLENSEREVNAYAREAGLIRSRGTTSPDGTSGDTATSITAASLDQLNEAANRARTERIAAESRWQAEAAQPLLSSGTVLANPTVQALLTRRSETTARLQALRSRYLDDYPEITQLQSELDTINAQLRQVAQSIRDSVREQYTAASAAEGRLTSQVAALQGDTMAEQDRSVRYNTLAREADTNRSIYDGLLQRYRELNASAGISNSNLSIVDRADVPQGPSSPSLVKNLLIAILLGLVAAAALVFLRDMLDDAIRVPEDVTQKINLPLLGVIPKSDGDTPDDEMADPKSPIAEAYNSLRGQLMYATADGLPNIILVTSSQPSEGKTTTSNAIALGLARMGKRVVLIDADLRRPSEHKRHKLPNKLGTSSLLTGAANLDDQVIFEVAPNLYVIPSGPIPPSPTELLAGPRIAKLLEDLSQRFDNIILDSPPVLGLADAPVLSPLADGVVFVIEADRGRGGMLKTALRRLQAMNPVILGAVLTKFNPNKAENKYSEYYGYEYYRYSSADDRN